MERREQTKEAAAYQELVRCETSRLGTATGQARARVLHLAGVLRRLCATVCEQRRECHARHHVCLDYHYTTMIRCRLILTGTNNMI